jgi:septal ring factor EnvC (AmiA/AmiB activator)
MKYLKDILLIAFILISLYWMFFIMKPSNDIAIQTYKKIDSLNQSIDSIETMNRHLDSQLVNYNNQILSIDTNISKLQNQKITIKEIYHEKINNIDNYNVYQLDSFFAKRYYYGN